MTETSVQRVASRYLKSAGFIPLQLPQSFIPQTAGQWELYESMPGANRAAKAMTQALTVALNMIGRNMSTSISDDRNIKVLRQVLARMSRTMNTYGDFGAMDSEPTYKARNAIRRYLHKLGFDEFDDQVLWDIVASAF